MTEPGSPRPESTRVDQGILVLSCSASVQPRQLIREIIGNDEDPKPETAGFGHRDIVCYPWHITTKYYEADVHFLELPEMDLVSASFSKVIEAVVLYIDIQEDSFTQAKCWQTFVNEFEPEIKMLVVDSLPESPSSAIPRNEIQSWCIDNGYELIEIHPQEHSDNDEIEDDFHESNSYLRIRQGLHAHPWPTLDLKDCPAYRPSDRFQELLDEEERNKEERINRLKEGMTERVDSLLSESSQILEGISSENNPEAFENLFDKFAEMKEKASHLNGDERKVFAEKTAIAFWKALGGDQSEIDGLDGDDQENEQQWWHRPQNIPQNINVLM